MSECPVRGCCAHLLQYKAEHGLQTLLAIRRYAELSERGRAARIRVPVPRCSTCGTTEGKLFACLTCVHIACRNDTLLHYKMKAHALCLLSHTNTRSQHLLPPALFCAFRTPRLKSDRCARSALRDPCAQHAPQTILTRLLAGHCA